MKPLIYEIFFPKSDLTIFTCFFYFDFNFILFADLACHELWYFNIAVEHQYSLRGKSR